MMLPTMTASLKLHVLDCHKIMNIYPTTLNKWKAEDEMFDI